MPTDSAKVIEVAHEQGSVMPADVVGREVRDGGAILPPSAVVLAPRALEVLVRSLTYTPTIIKQVLRQGEGGDLGEQLRMFVKMIEGDAHLSGIVETRSRLIAQAEYALAPPRGLEEDSRALAAVSYCEAVLDSLNGFSDALGLLNRGQVLGFQALEVEWADVVPIALHLVPETEWRWETGVGLQYRNLKGEWKQAEPDRFVINSPLGFSTNIARRGVMRRLCYPWVLKNYATMDWAAFVEIFGVPPRWAKYPTTWKEGDPRIATIHDALEAMAASGTLAVPDSVELGALAAGGRAGTNSPHELFVEWADRQMSKAVLGQTLTTDTSGSTGTYAAAKVHNEVRLDMAQGDAMTVGHVVRRDLLAPIVGYGLGWDWPVPMMAIRIEDPDEEARQADKLDKAVNKLGLPVPAAEARAQLRIRAPEQVDGTDPSDPEYAEEILPGERQQPSASVVVPELPAGGAAALAAHRHGHALARDQVADDVQLTNDALAAMGAEDWRKLSDGFLTEDVRELLRRNPDLTFDQALERIQALYRTAPVDALAEHLLQFMTASDVNGRAEVDHEAGNIRPEEGGTT
jgi:phage gp29-like protein